MRVTFLMPGYAWVPSGGFKVVYEYANQLVARGHEVAVVHPRRLNWAPRKPFSLRRVAFHLRERISIPTIGWHAIDPRVNLLFVPNSAERNLPDADLLFATAWDTVASVMFCPNSKGAKCYLIQHYETWQGHKQEVDATWTMPLHKVVVSRWLQGIARDLGTVAIHIPNAVDHNRYRFRIDPRDRPRRVAMMFSTVSFKAARDGIDALCACREMFPELTAVLFGAEPRKSWVPDWMEYHADPTQETIVDIYNGAKIFLSSSLTEGFCLPAAEAAACGCAIVATDSGGIRDFVEDNVSALLSSPHDPAALAKHLCRVLANDELALRLAHNARLTIEGFTWKKSACQLESFMEEALSSQADGRTKKVIAYAD